MLTPDAKHPDFIITTLAEYQTPFWGSVGQELRRHGFNCVFLSFDDRSTEMLNEQGLKVWNVRALQNRLTEGATEGALAEAMKRLGMTDTNLWFSHERLFFRISDSRVLHRKFLGYIRALEEIFGNLVAQRHNLILIQELGGFLSVIATYYVARRYGIDSYFLEPSFFRGRLFFSRNSFRAPTIPVALPVSEVPIELREYLESTLSNRTIVIPKKDSHHYSPAIKKIINGRNIRRLAEKVLDKYLLGKKQEFGYIGNHVLTHLRMAWTSQVLRHRYTSLDGLDRFIYYPLHVPADVALTLRAPHCVDQLALVDHLARVIPIGMKLVVKEHPAMAGAVDCRRLCNLLDRHDNLYLLPPETNNFDVLGRADLVVSVNSKSGAEALLLGKPVVVLGDAFYRNSGLVLAAHDLEKLGDVLQSALRAQPPDRASVERYFTHVWNHSLPGELYVNTLGNVSTFVASLLEATRGTLARRSSFDAGHPLSSPQQANS